MNIKCDFDLISRRLLALLMLPGAVGRVQQDSVIVSITNNGISLSKGSTPVAAVDILLARGLVEWIEMLGGQYRILQYIPQNIERAQVQNSEGSDIAAPPDQFRQQHSRLSEIEIGCKSQKTKVYFNEAESPILWMRRRKGRDGMPMITAMAFAAGERLRQDFTLANMTPRVTADWSNPSRGTGGGQSAMNFSDTMIAARQRMEQALSFCGPEFSGVLLDLCCFLKGLEQIEQEHGWPARSAKVVVNLGLSKLARHYGFSEEAKGVAQKGKIVSWSDTSSVAGL